MIERFNSKNRKDHAAHSLQDQAVEFIAKPKNDLTRNEIHHVCFDYALLWPPRLNFYENFKL